MRVTDSTNPLSELPTTEPGPQRPHPGPLVLPQQEPLPLLEVEPPRVVLAQACQLHLQADELGTAGSAALYL